MSTPREKSIVAELKMIKEKPRKSKEVEAPTRISLTTGVNPLLLAERSDARVNQIYFY